VLKQSAGVTTLKVQWRSFELEIGFERCFDFKSFKFYQCGFDKCLFSNFITTINLFNAYNGGGKIIFTQAISTFMTAAGNGYSAGSGNSINSGKNFSSLLAGAAIVITNLSARYSTAYNVMQVL